MYITRKKSTDNLKLSGNRIVSPETLTLSVASAADWLDYRSGSFWIEAAIDCLCAVSDGMINVECRDANFNSYV